MNSFDVLDYLPKAREEVRQERRESWSYLFDAINENHAQAIAPAPVPVKPDGIVARLLRRHTSEEVRAQ